MLRAERGGAFRPPILLLATALGVMSLITTKSSAERRLIELGLSLPQIRVPVANFVPFRRNGDNVGRRCEFVCRRQDRLQARAQRS